MKQIIVNVYKDSTGVKPDGYERSINAERITVYDEEIIPLYENGDITCQNSLPETKTLLHVRTAEGREFWIDYGKDAFYEALQELGCCAGGPGSQGLAEVVNQGNQATSAFGLVLTDGTTGVSIEDNGDPTNLEGRVSVYSSPAGSATPTVSRSVSLIPDGFIGRQSTGGALRLAKFNLPADEYTLGSPALLTLATRDWVLKNAIATKTRAQIVSLISGSALVPGQIYRVTGVDTAMYGGTDIFLRALSATQFETKGYGIFYNPKYNFAMGANSTWQIWSKQMYGTFTPLANPNTGKVSLFAYGELVTANNGATAKYRAHDWLEYVSGNWSGATSVTASNGRSANVAGMNSPSYTANTNIIWGGKHWVNANGALGDSTSVYALNSEWTALPFNASDYNMVLDEIEYDVFNDWVVFRREVRGNNQVRCSRNKTLGNGDPIKAFQFGNPYSTVYDAGNGNVTVENSYFCNINNYSRIDNVQVVNGSTLNDLLARPFRRRLRNLVFSQSSLTNIAFTQISESSFFGFSGFGNSSLDLGSIERLVLEDNTTFSGIQLIPNPGALGSGLKGHFIKSTLTNMRLSNTSVNLNMNNSSLIGVDATDTVIDASLLGSSADFTATAIFSGNNKRMEKISYENAVFTQDMTNSTTLFNGPVSYPRKVTNGTSGATYAKYINNVGVEVIQDAAI